MKIIKNGGHRLFEEDPQTAQYVAEMRSLYLTEQGTSCLAEHSGAYDRPY